MLTSQPTSTVTVDSEAKNISKIPNNILYQIFSALDCDDLETVSILSHHMRLLVIRYLNNNPNLKYDNKLTFTHDPTGRLSLLSNTVKSAYIEKKLKQLQEISEATLKEYEETKRIACKKKFTVALPHIKR